MSPLRITKRAYVCWDGPWCGHTLYMSSPFTLPVLINGILSRYRVGPVGYLYWERLNG
jgi:hypothetical protein